MGTAQGESKAMPDTHGDDIALRVRAIESLLIEKGPVQPPALAAIAEAYETKIWPHNGAQVVARAWTDPAYKARLLSDATAAIAELSFSGVQGEDMVVVENTPTVHNMVVCTLCSLPMADARPAAELVQVCALSCPRGHRPARGADRVRR